MLAPVLIAAGLGFGVWWLLRKDDKEEAPALPPPDEVNLVSAHEGSAADGQYTVMTLLLNNDKESYHNMADFSSWRAAWEYYKQVVAFLDENYPNWTCPQNSGYAMVTLLDEWAQQKAVKTYPDCPGDTPYSQTRSLRGSLDPVRDFFGKLAGQSGVATVPRYPVVKLAMIPADGAQFYGTWKFDSTPASVAYYQQLQEAFRTKAAVEFYRPDQGKLLLMVAWPDWEVGWTGGRYVEWNGTEEPDQEGMIRPSTSGQLVVDFL